MPRQPLAAPLQLRQTVGISSAAESASPQFLRVAVDAAEKRVPSVRRNGALSAADSAEVSSGQVLAPCALSEEPPSTAFACDAALQLLPTFPLETAADASAPRSARAGCASSSTASCYLENGGEVLVALRAAPDAAAGSSVERFSARDGLWLLMASPGKDGGPGRQVSTKLLSSDLSAAAAASASAVAKASSRSSGWLPGSEARALRVASVAEGAKAAAKDSRLRWSLLRPSLLAAGSRRKSEAEGEEPFLHEGEELALRNQGSGEFLCIQRRRQPSLEHLCVALVETPVFEQVQNASLGAVAVHCGWRIRPSLVRSSPPWLLRLPQVLVGPHPLVDADETRREHWKCISLNALLSRHGLQAAVHAMPPPPPLSQNERALLEATREKTGAAEFQREEERRSEAANWSLAQLSMDWPLLPRVARERLVLEDLLSLFLGLDGMLLRVVAQKRAETEESLAIPLKNDAAAALPLHGRGFDEDASATHRKGARSSAGVCTAQAPLPSLPRFRVWLHPLLLCTDENSETEADGGWLELLREGASAGCDVRLLLFAQHVGNCRVASGGLTRSAFQEGLGALLGEVASRVVAWESAVRAGRLSLQAFRAAAAPVGRALAVASEAVRCTWSLRGGALLNALEDCAARLPPGDSGRAILLLLHRQALQPVLRMAEAWLLRGELRDPFEEFFIR